MQLCCDYKLKQIISRRDELPREVHNKIKERRAETEKERGEDPNPNPRNPKNEGVCLCNDSRSNVEWIQKSQSMEANEAMMEGGNRLGKICSNGNASEYGVLKEKVTADEEDQIQLYMKVSMYETLISRWEGRESFKMHKRTDEGLNGPGMCTRKNLKRGDKRGQGVKG